MKTSNLFMVLTKVLLMLMVSISIMSITAIKAKSQDIDNPVTFEQKEKLSFEGTSIEIKGEEVVNPVTKFFQDNMWAMGLLIGLSFLFVVRVVIVNAICNDWNAYLDKYRNHMINSNCLSWDNERRIELGYVHPTYREYLMLKKWDITDFLEDKLLYGDVMMWNKEVELYCN